MIVKHCSWSLFSSPTQLQRLSAIGGITALVCSLGIGFAPAAWSITASEDPLSLPEGLLEPISEKLFAQNQSSPLLQFGSEGPDVQIIQSLLQLLGYYSGVVDGRYQESTVIAVSAFQSAAGLSDDGILGPTTWEKLLPSVAQIQATQSNPESSADAPSTVATNPSGNSPGLSPSSTASEGENDGPEEANSDRSTDEPSANSAGGADSSSVSSSSVSTSGTIDDIRLPTLRLGMRGPAVQNLQERLSSLGLLQGRIDGIFGDQTEESVKSAQRSFNLTPDGVVGPATWRALLQ